MSNRFFLILLIFPLLCVIACEPSLKEQFKNPPRQYKPMPFWHINGELTTEGIRQQMQDAHDAGFTGVSLLPLATWKNKVGTSPEFLSDDYFDRYQDMIDIAEELDMEIILYDDNDFPTGMAGGKLGELFPEHTMKRLDKIETYITGPGVFIDTVEAIKLMAAVAMNSETFERIEISEYVKDGTITWNVPEGSWKIMLFPMVKDSWHKAYPVVDYLDTTAVSKMINLTYDVYAQKYSTYFGDRIKMTFFDDVGFWRHPYTWTGKFNEKFEELHGYDPRPYYPALWHDIGPESVSVRNAFFHTRAELLAEGFPKLAAQWNDKHGLKSTGHPPGNYDPTPIDMNADIFKFYRYTQIPLVDVIIRYQFGQDGHKLISSAADYYDRPVVSTEIYGAFRERDQHFDSMMLYRPMFEMFTRGVNFVIPHGMWYNPEKVYIQPLVSTYNEEIAPALPSYSDFVGRSCLLLQGGRNIAEIGVMYPFEELAGHFVFDNPDGIRQGFYISPETDYQDISGILSNDVRRDFTFIHPEFFLEDKYAIEEGIVKLQNQENYQEYKVLFLTGCNTISYKTLEKLKTFYESGGSIISTTQLPYKSSEMGHDQRIVELVRDIFDINPLLADSIKIEYNSNTAGGVALHIPKPDKDNIQEELDKLMNADVKFTPNPVLSTDFGKFNYIHKMKDGQHIYMFTNSSNEYIDTEVLLKGKLDMESWNPHNGRISEMKTLSYVNQDGEIYTKIRLMLNPVKSMFWIGKD